ncbi:MAG: hypothetical protein QN229_03070 [Desulfurococcaceae archaeon TW002]
MGTIRSEYSIEQFEAALQRFAHQITDMMQRIDKMHVSSEKMDVDLEFSYGVKGEVMKIYVSFYKRDKPDSWGESLSFTVEPKDYVDSPHITKIHYEGANDKQYSEKILTWLKSLLGSEKPAVSFSLKDFSKKVNRRLTDYKAFSKG